MTISQPLDSVQSLNIIGCISVAGILLTVLVAPKFASAWVLQVVNRGLWLLHTSIAQLLYCFVDRGWAGSVVFASGHIESALTEIKEERKFTEAERDAFQEFADDIRTLPAHDGGMTESSTMLIQKNETSSNEFETIRQRYQDTVMSVPNYNVMYDEGFAESFSAEFGEELSIVIKNGSQFSTPIKQMLLKQISTSIADRERHLNEIITERDSVMSAKSQLLEFTVPLERTDPQELPNHSFEDLVEREEALRSAKDEHKQILNDRQEDIHNCNRSVRRNSGGAFLQEYLYQSLDTQFPVLSAVLKRITAINHRRRTVINSISRRY